MSSVLTPKSKNKQNQYSASKKNLKYNNQDLFEHDSSIKHNEDVLFLTPPSSTVTDHAQSPISSKIAKSYESETDLLKSKCLKFSNDLDELSSKIKVFIN
jgi:hypothetical protein